MDPNEFHLYEVKHGGPVTLTLGIRISRPMDVAIKQLEWDSRADKSVIVRAALYEYFQKRGVNALTGV